jgi:hypothetical protein
MAMNIDICNNWMLVEYMYHHLNMEYWNRHSNLFDNLYQYIPLDIDTDKMMNLVKYMYLNFDMVEKHMVHMDIDIEDQ